MYIGICDDNNIDLAKIKKIVSDTLFDIDDINIISYNTGKDIIDDISQELFKCDLLFLDIFMKPDDGMKVAEFIRENGVDVDIIFVTNSTEHVYEGYLYKAFAYILKNSAEEKLPEAIRRYIKEISSIEENLNITSEGVNKKIPISKILYIESDARKLIIHMKKETVSFYAKMSELEEILKDKGFVRIHQSYMVRMDSVTKYTKSVVYIGEVPLPISRKYSSRL